MGSVSIHPILRIGAVAIVLLFGPLAWADNTAAPIPPAPLEEWERVLQSGRSELARKLVAAAYDRQPDPRLLCAFGRIAKIRQQTVRAYDFFHRCLAEGGNTLSRELTTEAQAGAAEPPDGAGELAVSSKRSGLLFIGDELTARVRPGEPLRLTLPTDPQELRLVVEGGPPVALSVKVVPQSQCDADLDQQLFSCATVVLLLPSGAGSSTAASEPGLSALYNELGSALRLENGRLVQLSRQRTLFEQQPALLKGLAQLENQASLGRLAGASYTMGLNITPDPFAQDSTQLPYYVLDAWLVEVNVVEKTAAESTTCNHCSQSDLLRSVGELSRRVLSSGRRPVRTLQISSIPPSDVFIDDQPRGHTPLRVLLLPGEHQITLRHPYFQPHTERVTIEEDIADRGPRIAVRLSPLPLSKAERAIRVSSWLCGGVGLGLLATGAGLFNREDYVAPVNGASRELDQPGATLTYTEPSLGLMISGGALLLTSGVLLVVDRYRASLRRVK